MVYQMHLLDVMLKIEKAMGLYCAWKRRVILSLSLITLFTSLYIRQANAV